MHTLYDSEAFTVTHLQATAETAPGPATDGEAQRPELLRNGFEIVDKRAGREIYLDGSWAELFQQRLAEWQRNSPTQEEVEDVLAQYTELATLPLYMH